MRVTDESWIGQTIDGRYVVRRFIGKGGMGAVFEGEQPSLQRRVALKFLLARDEAHAQRFRREARNASQVVHEHVAQVYDVGRTEDGHEYIVMEYVEGTDLQQVLSEHGALTVERAVKIARAMLEGLAAIHAQGVVHRDIKPSNVLLTTRGTERDFVKVGDFGLARAADDATLTKTGNIVGTTPYMAPEVFRGEKLDHRADLYAVGITLYQMLAGKLPFVGITAEIGALHVFSPPPPLGDARTDVPAWLVKIVERALAKAKEDRFEDANAFIAALDRKRAGAAPSRPSDAAATVVERGRKRSRARWPWVLAAIAIAGGVGIGAYLARTPRAAAPLPSDARVEVAGADGGESVPDPIVETPRPADAAVGVDAAIAAAPADGGMAKRTGKRCACVAADQATPLCPAAATPKCLCRHAANEVPLCPFEPSPCVQPDRERYEALRLAGLEYSDICRENNEWRCPDLGWFRYRTPGTHGGACAGYTVMLFRFNLTNVSERVRQSGTLECDSCPDADHHTFRGAEGDRCTGYRRETGEAVAGTLRQCR